MEKRPSRLDGTSWEHMLARRSSASLLLTVFQMARKRIRGACRLHDRKLSFSGATSAKPVKSSFSSLRGQGQRQKPARLFGVGLALPLDAANFKRGSEPVHARMGTHVVVVMATSLALDVGIVSRRRAEINQGTRQFGQDTTPSVSPKTRFKCQTVEFDFTPSALVFSFPRSQAAIPPYTRLGIVSQIGVEHQ
ncbi:hypothetical protein Micbo1qcDRAFT_160858 [Microdochium bolleyi]|uniref:Uncharacterized protein n=1 Tax=Microdochium bolleyi TaxID=196109 RepID=A0A136J718_9PEZI|nr:hypothetical protein Micbo1qcDRAFT_160858 [Microdochium bolleyi]